MKIKLEREWMGHPEGSEITVAKTMAMRLEHMGTATILDKPEPVEPTPPPEPVEPAPPIKTDETGGDETGDDDKPSDETGEESNEQDGTDEETPKETED